MPSVLVVDDEPDVRLIARVVLTAAGFEVREVDVRARRPWPTLAAGRSPDVVLLDVRMPGLDGWDVLRAHPGATPRSRDLPVVVFTADLVRPGARRRRSCATATC